MCFSGGSITEFFLFLLTFSLAMLVNQHWTKHSKGKFWWLAALSMSIGFIDGLNLSGELVRLAASGLSQPRG